MNWGVSHGRKEQLLTYSPKYCVLTFAISILDQFETVKHVNTFCWYESRLYSGMFCFIFI